MVLDHAWGDQHNMSGRLDQQGLVGSVAQSTEGRWTTTGTLVWESTLTCQATTWPTSTSCLLRKSGVVTHLSLRQEKAIGLKNMEFWVKEEWTGGAEKSPTRRWCRGGTTPAETPAEWKSNGQPGSRPTSPSPSTSSVQPPLKKTTLFGLLFLNMLQNVIFTFLKRLFKPVEPWIFPSRLFTWRGTVLNKSVRKYSWKCKSFKYTT